MSRDALKNIQNLMSQERLQEALHACQHLHRTEPGNVQSWVLACQILGRANQSAKAVAMAERALDVVKGHPVLALNLCHCLLADKRVDSAREHLLSLARKGLDDARSSADLAQLLMRVDEHREALRCYQMASELQPYMPVYHYNLATVQRFLGLIPEAERSLDRALALDPLDGEAQLMRSNLKKQMPDNNHLRELNALLLREDLKPETRVQCGFAAAKESEDVGDYRKSFTFLQAATNLRRQHLIYEIDDDVKRLEEIKNVFNRDFFQHEEERGPRGRGAIFVLGMPRTGSTLVERVLASHSDVYAAGELDNFGLELTKSVRALAVSERPRSFIEASADIDFAQLGQAYLDSLKPEARNSLHFIDKLPFNYLYLGLIHKALPAAKIVHIHRDPMDTCYAIYKQLFRDAYPFSYQLEELADYYIAYDRLIKHWRECLPGLIFDLSYEGIVNDIEGSAKALLDHCGLTWQQNCLHFESNQAAVTSASATQVRQGLYQSSVGMWRHYEDQLQVLAKRLKEAGVDFAD